MAGMSTATASRPNPSTRPCALVTCGPPASGKSTLATATASYLGIPSVSSDIVRKRLAGISRTTRGLPEHYGASISQSVYAELGRRAAQLVHAHGGVIIDATFGRHADRAAFAAAYGNAAPVLFAELRAPLEVLVARAETRESDPARVSDATALVVSRVHGQWQPLAEVPAHQHVTIRSDQAITLVVAHLAAAMAAKATPPAARIGRGERPERRLI
jgi:predicted kinase